MNDDTFDDAGIHVHGYDTGNRPEEGKGVWTKDELLAEFEVVAFMAPYVEVRRKSDGQKGLMEFTHQPRRYFNFEPTSG
jgi:hypothetical protein